MSLIASQIEELPWKHPVTLYGLSRISTRCFKTTAISDILKILIICLTTIPFIHYVWGTSCTLVKPECFNFGGLCQCLWHYSPLIRLQKSQFLIFQPRCELLVLKWQLKLFSRMRGILDPLEKKMVLVISVIQKVKFSWCISIDFWGQIWLPNLFLFQMCIAWMCLKNCFL